MAHANDLISTDLCWWQSIVWHAHMPVGEHHSTDALIRQLNPNWVRESCSESTTINRSRSKMVHQNHAPLACQRESCCNCSVHVHCWRSSTHAKLAEMTQQLLRTLLSIALLTDLAYYRLGYKPTMFLSEVTLKILFRQRLHMVVSTFNISHIWNKK